MASCAKWGSPLAAVRPHPGTRSARGASCTGEFRRCAGQLRRCAGERTMRSGTTCAGSAGAIWATIGLPSGAEGLGRNQRSWRGGEVRPRSEVRRAPAGRGAPGAPDRGGVRRLGEVRWWGGGPWARRPPELARGPRQWCWGAGGAEPLWCWRGVLAWGTARCGLGCSGLLSVALQHTVATCLLDHPGMGCVPGAGPAPPLAEVLHEAQELVGYSRLPLRGR